ncbi:MAG TPA: type II toxin-antitoxin system HicB family antitoxin [Candidatus Limnocylindria bacterium]
MTAKRVLISIDERLLARIDASVARRGLTRSGYLAQLAATDLEAGHGPGAEPAVSDTLRRVED